MFVFILLIPFLTEAQTIQITEIAPHTLANQPEWFEFSVTGIDLLDMNGWQLSNGKSTKDLSDFTDLITLGDGVTGTDDPLIFKLEGVGYFSFSPSPISLPNGGGTVQILDAEDQILNTINYPEASSSSTKNYEQREVWNWDNDTNILLPQLVRSPAHTTFNHTKDLPNNALPTHPSLFTALINEVSVDHDDTDFIEILLLEGPEKIDLQYFEIKHNGTPLWYFENSFLVQPGDYLVFKVGTPDNGKASDNLFHSNKRDGVSGGSGTVEIIALSGTSQEQTIDTVCWQKKNLSQTESQRVQKFRTLEHWREACVDIGELIPNESIARPIGAGDGNTKSDWFRHFNGSIAAENQKTNKPPTAVIEIQGTKRVVGEISFLVNPTGENSTDPDGPKDLNSYRWTLNGNFLSDEANPASFYLEIAGEYQLRLTVRDQSGAASTVEQLLVGLSPSKRNTNRRSAEAQTAVVEQLIKQTLSDTQVSSTVARDDFFDVYLNRTDWTQTLLKTTSLSLSPEADAKTSSLYETNWKRQINLPKPVRQRLKKNLGLLFSWRESPWPGLAAEWPAVVANDQKFGYFELVYRGF